MAPDPYETRTAIQSALDALKRGDRVAARRQAELAASQAPDQESPWLILAALSAPDEGVAYARRALHANPSSTRAREALIWTLQRQQSLAAQGLVEEPGLPLSPVVAPQPAPSRVQQPSPEELKEPVSPAQASPLAEPQLASSWEEITHELKVVRVSPPATVSPGTPPAPALTGARVAPAVPLQPKPAKPSSPPKKRRQPTSSPDRVTLFFLAGWLVLAFITGLSFLRPQLAGLFAGGTRPSPTPPCVQPMLQVSTLKFPIRSIARPADGSLPLPAQADIAWWLEGTSVNYVFDLNPTEASVISLNNVAPGNPVTITWADCSTEDYQVSAVTSQAPLSASLLDQSQAGITIFIPTRGSLASLLIQGTLQGATITTFNTPDASLLQAEVSLLGTTPSSDGTTITVGVSILNTGQAAITLNAVDVSLTSSDAAALALLSSDPGLPKEIDVGGREIFYFIFARPPTSTSTLKVLGVEFDLEGY